MGKGTQASVNAGLNDSLNCQMLSPEYNTYDIQK